MAGVLCGKLPKPADKVGKKHDTLGKIVGGHDITSDSVIEKVNENLKAHGKSDNKYSIKKTSP